MELCRKIVDELQKQIKSFPEGFYDTFDFTDTGNNLTHPCTIGILCKILWDIKTIAAVYVDMRFNDKGKKFQPDITAFDKNNKPIIFLDYESPNSSDARVPDKDIKSYTNWRESRAPYLIITTLPDRKALNWKVRWTARGQWDYLFRDDKSKSKIKKNPFRFWYSYYRKHMKDKDTHNIFFANINGKSVSLINVKKKL
jgi:hypothetical protein